MICARCENYTLAFPLEATKYWKQSGWGWCKKRSAATIYNPVTERECGQYEAAKDMAKREQWIRGIK